MQHSKWLAKLGATGYDTLILINRLANFISEKIFHRGKLSLSKKIKNTVKSAVSFINDFEQTAADIAISNQYDYVVCGHIHQPEIRRIINEKGETVYLNSGDWIENLTALEYVQGEWRIYKFDELEKAEMREASVTDEDADNSRLFTDMLAEFNLIRN
jgi:UDP-2,3-diacylglucosamine pyrophosphatase LpxH